MRKTINRILKYCVTVLISISMMTPVFAQGVPFTDVPVGSWFYDYVKYVNDQGLMTGLDATTFGPTENLARAQFATILYRMNNEPSVQYTNKFPDVADGQWYTDAILWASNAGIVTGYSDTGKFGPADPINREQIAVMMYRYANYLGYDTKKQQKLYIFYDGSNVNSFAIEALGWASAHGIITGKNYGTLLDPQGYAIRAECATIIMRFVEYGEDGCPLESYTPQYIYGNSIDQYGNEVYLQSNGWCEVKFADSGIRKIIQTKIENDGRFFKEMHEAGAVAEQEIMDRLLSGDFSGPTGYVLDKIYYLGKEWWQIIWKE